MYDLLTTNCVYLRKRTLDYRKGVLGFVDIESKRVARFGKRHRCGDAVTQLFATRVRKIFDCDAGPTLCSYRLRGWFDKVANYLG